MGAGGLHFLSRNAPRLRVAILASVPLAAFVSAALAGWDPEVAMGVLVLLLFLLAPVLAWSVVEPEPEPRLTLGPRARGPLWLRFPFHPGGGSGVAFFVLVFAVAVGSYALLFRLLCGVWLAHDNPVQMALGALYACVYVLLPTGLFAPFLHRAWGRVAALAACAASYPLLMALFPPGAREPWTLTELGNPWDMMWCVLHDGTLIHYARDDFAALAGLAALGIGLHVPRVVRRARALSRAAREAPVTAAVESGTATA